MLCCFCTGDAFQTWRNRLNDRNPVFKTQNARNSSNCLVIRIRIAQRASIIASTRRVRNGERLTVEPLTIGLEDEGEFFGASCSLQRHSLATFIEAWLAPFQSVLNVVDSTHARHDILL